MTQDRGKTGADQAPLPESAKHQDPQLARNYQRAAADDAYHERSDGAAAGEQDVVLVAKKGGQHAPSTDPAPDDKPVKGSHRAPADGESGGPTVSDEALKRGLTPGEMGAGKEPQERTKVEPSAD